MTLFYIPSLTALTPLTSHSDGTPNIILFHHFVFPTNGYIVGFRFWHDSSPSGTYRFSVWTVTNITDGNNYDTDFIDFVDVVSPYTGLTPGAYNDVMLGTPIATDNTKLYAFSVQSNVGRYQFYTSNALNSSHGTYPTDKIYQPGQSEDLAAAGISSFPGYNSNFPGGFDIGSGNDPSQTPDMTQAYYGITPIYADTLGGSTVNGTISTNLGGLTATAAGERYVKGTLTTSLGGLTATATGERYTHGLATTTLGPLFAQAVGDRTTHGTINTVLGFLSNIVAERTHHGTMSASLGGLTATIVGGGGMANLIQLSDLVTAMGRDPYNEEEEAYWNRIITTVSYYINSKVRVGFFSTTVTATYQADAYGQIYLREPVTNIASITNYRTGNSDLYVDFDGVCKLFYLEPHQVVNVVYTYGYSEPPQDIQDLCISLCVQQITEEMPSNLKSYKVGDVQQGYGNNATTSQMMFDDMVNGVLDNYRRRFYSIPLTLEIFPDYQPRGYLTDFAED